MRVIDLGQAGESFSDLSPTWADLGIPRDWLRVIDKINPASKPHDIQAKVLGDARLLSSRRNLIASGPTNSGKSLLGYLALLQGIQQGRRGLLIEPFRALAQERFDELSLRLPTLKDSLGKIPGVAITTGDYRLAGDTFTALPPEDGEIVIATPERIDAIMRNPDFDKWVRSFGVVCVDEGHLVGDPRRGPTLESVVTRFLCEKAPPRIILLSATLGSCDSIKRWLEPCDVALSTTRRPPLHQELRVMEEGDTVDGIIAEFVAQALANPDASVLVFVYQTSSASRLAEFLNQELAAKFGAQIASAYHSKMSAKTKIRIRDEYEKGRIRCLVSTTALGTGVNLPATHVIVRDLTFGQEGALPLRDLLQMMGRAGRGQRTGHAAAVLRPTDRWQESDLQKQIQNPILPELKSTLTTTQTQAAKRDSDINAQTAKMVLGRLVRRDLQKISDLEGFFDRSLGGRELSGQIVSTLRWLSDGQRLLSWADEKNRYSATAFGKAISGSAIPIDVGVSFASLIRDLLSSEPEDKALGQWSGLDTLLVLELLDPRERGLRRFSNDLCDQVDDWLERSNVKSTLFSTWLRGAKGASKAQEVFGSLGVSLENRQDEAEVARQQSYLAVMRAIVISQLGNGLRCEDIGRRWGTPTVEGVEERWRDHLLWQLGGLVKILEVPCFYYQLKEECKADLARVSRVGKHFARIRQDIYDTMGNLRFCSPLGPLFRELEEARSGVGARTKEKLENLGISTLLEIHKKTEAALIAAGIQKRIATKLKGYAANRLR